MTKMNFSKYSINFKGLLLGAGLIFNAASIPAHATGDGDECYNMECNSWFTPEIIDSPDEAPFFRSGHTLYGESGTNRERRQSIQQVNSLEWSAYYKYQVSPKALDYLLYTMDNTELENLSSNLLNGKKERLTREGSAVSAGLLAFINQPKGDAKRLKIMVANSIALLAFAKTVEPYANQNTDYDSWETSPTSDTNMLTPALVKYLVDIATKQILIAGKNKFITQRFQLQILRLYFFGGEYEAANAYYDRTIADFGSLTRNAPDNDQYYDNEKDGIKYRFVDYAAGALYKTAAKIFIKQKNNEKLSQTEMQTMTAGFAKANYLYSLIFDQFLPLKTTSYFSFHPMDEADWNATLKMAKNSHETEILWQLLGIYADGISAIEHIYALNPASKTLPLLLVREVNKGEESWTLNRENIKHPEYNDNKTIATSDVEAVGIQRLNLLEKIAREGKVTKPYLWQLSVGHLKALAGDMAASSKFLNQAQTGMPAGLTLVQSQIRMSRLFGNVESLKAVTPEIESKLAVELSWLEAYKGNEANYRAATLHRWISEKLSELYTAKGDRLRALLLQDDAGDPFYRDNVKLDSLIELMTNPVSPFDQYLASATHYSVGQLHELKGLNSLYAEKLDQAANDFSQVGKEIASQVLLADPFMIHIQDNHDRDFEIPHDKYTKITFLQRMLALSATAKGTDQAAAEASLLLGNAFYSMSYYGNGRDIYDTVFGNLRMRFADGDRNAELSLNQDLAKKYYQRAFELTADKQVKAKVLWMLAKVERNKFLNAHNLPSFGDNAVLQAYLDQSETFKKFKAEFSDTEYFREVIRECGYFATHYDL